MATAQNHLIELLARKDRQHLLGLCAPVPLVLGAGSGLQRYLCRECGKTSNATTGTPLSRLRHKERFEAYARCVRAGMTVRQAAAEVGVCVDTAHRWRLRFLANVEAHQPKAVTGMLEVDETYFRESQNGSRHMARPSRARGGKASGRGRATKATKDWVPVLVGRARGQNHTAGKVLTRMTGAQVTDALKDAVQAGETALCTDGHSAFLHLQRTLGGAHQELRGQLSRPRARQGLPRADRQQLP